MPKIIMYKTPICPYCIKAKNLLAQKRKTNIEEIDISKNPDALTEMLEKTEVKELYHKYLLMTNILVVVMIYMRL